MTTNVNITEICPRFGRYSFHFADNIDPITSKPFKDTEGAIETKKGRGACTLIKNERVLCEFLLWLSPETRQMLPLEGIEKTLEFARRYKKI